MPAQGTLPAVHRAKETELAARGSERLAAVSVSEGPPLPQAAHGPRLLTGAILLRGSPSEDLQRLLPAVAPPSPANPQKRRHLNNAPWPRGASPPIGSPTRGLLRRRAIRCFIHRRPPIPTVAAPCRFGRESRARPTLAHFSGSQPPTTSPSCIERTNQLGRLPASAPKSFSGRSNAKEARTRVSAGSPSPPPLTVRREGTA